MMAGWHGHDKEPSGEPLIHIMKLYNIAEIEKLHVQLAASQAENLRLREALEYCTKQVIELATVPGVSQVLATPPGDQSALREVIARVMEESNYSRTENFATDLKELRSGEWTPEVLR